MKYLNGSELVGFIQQRQIRQVAALRQAHAVEPRLVILSSSDDSSIEIYTKIKQRYGEELGVLVETEKLDQQDLISRINQLNDDQSVHGIVVQLPLADMSEADQILNQINPSKDVDGLGEKSVFTAATAEAIIWLLNGYNVELKGRNIVMVGEGRLVGKPLRELLESMKLQPNILDIASEDLEGPIGEADIIISATGSAGLIKSDWIQSKTVVVDAGVAVEEGVVKGDLDDAVYLRDDLKITPKKGGVGPVTVAVLFDHLIRAASESVS